LGLGLGIENHIPHDVNDSCNNEISEDCEYDYDANSPNNFASHPDYSRNNIPIHINLLSEI